MTIFNGKQIMLVGLKGDKGDAGTPFGEFLPLPNSDLNNVTTTGYYYMDTMDYTNGIFDLLGIDTGGVLQVWNPPEAQGVPIIQTLFIEYGIYQRTTNISRSSWNDWEFVGGEIKEQIYSRDSGNIQNIKNKKITYKLSATGRGRFNIRNVKDSVILFDTTNCVAQDQAHAAIQVNFVEKNITLNPLGFNNVSIKNLATNDVEGNLSVMLSPAVTGSVQQDISFPITQYGVSLSKSDSNNELNNNIWIFFEHENVKFASQKVKWHLELTFIGYSPSLRLIPYLVDITEE